jgi:uncharacterized protein YggE
MFKKLSIFILVLSFACFVLTQDTEEPNPDLPPLVSVTGSGRVRAVPDKVVFNVGVQQRAKTVEEVQNLVDSASADIINYLQDNGVDDKDVQTSYVSLSPYYTQTGTEYGSTDVDFYTATNSLTVTLRNISRFDSILSGLYEAGVNSVDSISFDVEDLQAQKQEAKRRAVAQAREIADALTEGLNVTVGNVYSVSDNDYNSPPVPIYFATAADIEGGDSSVAGGEVEISQTVSVSFLIQN